MYIRTLPSTEGMVFVYPQARELTMWMKNTFLPLDMVFVSTDNEVVHVHRDAVPQSLRIISSVAEVTRVIELNAGALDEFGIAVGDRIVFPAQQPAASATDSN